MCMVIYVPCFLQLLILVLMFAMSGLALTYMHNYVKSLDPRAELPSTGEPTYKEKLEKLEYVLRERRKSISFKKNMNPKKNF
jgi:hypothetical protein